MILDADVGVFGGEMAMGWRLVLWIVLFADTTS